MVAVLVLWVCVEGGGTVDNLPVHTGAAIEGIVTVGPTETIISDRCAAEFATLGLLALVQRKHADFATFVFTPSLHKPLQFPDSEATAAANMTAQLPYVLACGRFVHYMKCMARDTASRTDEDFAKRLNTWFQEYVDGDPDATCEATKAVRPLVAAEIVVDDTTPGSRHFVLTVRPHYQMEGVAIAARLVTQLTLEWPRATDVR